MVLFASVYAISCSSDEAQVAATSAGSGGDDPTGTGGSSNGGAGAGSNEGGSGGNTGQYSSGVGAPPTEEAPCAGKIYDCGDLIDNDRDGFIDSQDPDCLGPCDNTEDGYHPGLPGDPADNCKLDCFWDTGNGSGNDGCYWDHRCDPLEVAPDFPPEGEGCAYDEDHGAGPQYTCAEALASQSQKCVDYCAPLTPNGCDCFGCCELPADSGKFVWLGSSTDNVGTCKIDTIDDPALCKPCTPVPGCDNPCDPCEYCLGKTELPPECFDPDGGTTEQCPPGVQPCGGAGQDPCEAGYYCITGCCTELPN